MNHWKTYGWIWYKCWDGGPAGAYLSCIYEITEPTAFTGELGSDKNQQKPLVMNE